MKYLGIFKLGDTTKSNNSINLIVIKYLIAKYLDEVPLIKFRNIRASRTIHNFPHDNFISFRSSNLSLRNTTFTLFKYDSWLPVLRFLQSSVKFVWHDVQNYTVDTIISQASPPYSLSHVLVCNDFGYRYWFSTDFDSRRCFSVSGTNLSEPRDPRRIVDNPLVNMLVQRVMV